MWTWKNTFEENWSENEQGWKIMSLRCKVCNTSGGINANQISCNGEWECQTCGNILDVDGNVSSLRNKWF